MRHAIAPPEATPAAPLPVVYGCAAATNSFYVIDGAGVIRKFGVSASEGAPAEFKSLGVLQAGASSGPTKNDSDHGAVLAWCGAHRVLLAATSASSVCVFDSRGKRMGSIATRGVRKPQPHVSAVGVGGGAASAWSLTVRVGDVSTPCTCVWPDSCIGGRQRAR